MPRIQHSGGSRRPGAVRRRRGRARRRQCRGDAGELHEQQYLRRLGADLRQDRAASRPRPERQPGGHRAGGARRRRQPDDAARHAGRSVHPNLGDHAEHAPRRPVRSRRHRDLERVLAARRPRCHLHLQQRLMQLRSKRHRTRALQSGFTIAEVLVATSLSLVAVSTFASFGRSQLSAMRNQAAQNDIQMTARSIVDLFTREVRSAGANPSCGPGVTAIAEARAGLVHIQSDLDGDGTAAGPGEDIVYQYRFSPDGFERVQNGTVDVLVDGVAARGVALSLLRRQRCGDRPRQYRPHLRAARRCASGENRAQRDGDGCGSGRHGSAARPGRERRRPAQPVLRQCDRLPLRERP